jgi:hypothetical protein
MRSKKPTFSYVNVDSDTLEVTLSKTRGSGLAIPVHEAGKMWEAIRSHFMYPTQFAAARQKSEPYMHALLMEAPLWLTTIGGIMWEGVIQNASWEIVKFAVASALTKLAIVGLAPTPEMQKSKETSVRAGWREYSQPGRKQYEMFLSIKRTVKALPRGHALAYARAKDDLEFGRLVRGEIEAKAQEQE